MLLQIAISLTIVAITIAIHASGSLWWLSYLFQKKTKLDEKLSFRKGITILSLTAIFLLLLHFIEITMWAILYLNIPQIKELAHLEEAVYFSMITYTTVGYGDITLEPQWRIISGFEAMDGILLFGWSTAMFFSAVQRILKQSIKFKMPGFMSD
jgi:voltage-gated potassium channel